MSTLEVAKPLELPNGTLIKNRFFKSAMSETLGSSGSPNEQHVNLYRSWANGGAGVVASGNVMVDPSATGEPGNVVIDEKDMSVLERWAKEGTRNDTQLWMQINHPGKQAPRSVCKEPVAPSAVPISGDYAMAFNEPRTLTNAEVKKVIASFIRTAVIAKKAGFTGVQIHGAHGYLVNQFLSPHDNRREDEYGGTLENRMRFLVEIYQGMREALGAKFPIALKLNSSDFGEGKFTESDSIEVIKKVAYLGMDLVEVSGGSYENPRMVSDSDEVFFLDFAQKVKKVTDIPVVVTGGFRTLSSMESALKNNETSMVGIARPMGLFPDIPNRIMDGTYETVKTGHLTTGFQLLDVKLGPLFGIAYYEQQMKRIANGKEVQLHNNAWWPILHSVWSHGPSALIPRRAK